MLPFEVPIASYAEDFVWFLLDNFQSVFDFISGHISSLVEQLNFALGYLPPWVLILILALLAWRLANWGTAVFTVIGLLIVENLGLWDPIVESTALILVAEVLVILIGIPLGILAAKSDWVDRIIRPILDFMQTMPAFVYLIPAVMLFGLGIVPGVIATVIFALPPLVRLTNLGIRQVPTDLVEAGEAFGSSTMQLLLKVQLPMANPTIMTGINQSIMLALSMVVISAMIGAGGIGSEVLRGIQRLDVGRGFAAGLAVVVLAIIMDRITQNIGRQKQTPQGG